MIKRLSIKKVISIIIVILLTFTVSSCNNNNTNDSEEGEASTVEESEDENIQDLLINNMWNFPFQSNNLYEFFEDGTGFCYSGVCDFEDMSMRKFFYEVKDEKLNITFPSESDEIDEKHFTCNLANEKEERPEYFDYLEFDGPLFYTSSIEEELDRIKKFKHYDYCPFHLFIAEDFNMYLHEDYVEKKAEWKNALIDYLKNDSDRNITEGYALIYVDNDEIPELVEYGGCEAVGCRIVTTNGETAYVKQFSRLGYNYIEKNNLIANNDGLMGHYYNRIYKIENGKLKLILDGRYSDLNNTPTQDKNGNFIYEYYIGEKKVSKSEYEKRIEDIMPSDKITPVLDSEQYKSYERICKEIIFK